ncbi:neurogenic protein mastermind-like [Homalodisca vitripennis]|uniref:neurogenic protein mastermind-like n=1 Tax=Homalodisca vitripennis TaxID=197043 RepID=UPI001EEC5A6B|nr:neurogenic protein mastermind-like [Homalodisca vitripennis]
MHRSIGKRIRMDEPPPPEYDTSNPMTPMDGSMADSQEPYTPYTPYSNQSTPMHGGVDVYGNNQQYEPQNNYEQQQQHLYEQQQQYEAQQQQQQYEAQLQQQQQQQQQEMEQESPLSHQAQDQTMQDVDNSGYDAPAQYEQPLTPLNLRGGRITRARLRNANQQNNPPPPPATPARKVATEERTTTRRKGVKRSYAETINDEDSSLYIIVRNGRVTLPRASPTRKRVPVRPTHTHPRNRATASDHPPRPNDDRCSSTPAVCDLGKPSSSHRRAQQ